MAKKETPAQEKQYYVLVDYKADGLKKAWKKGDIISISPDEAQQYLGPKIITPLRTALSTGQYVPDIEIATYIRPEPTLRSSTNVEPEKTPKKKTLLKNTLRAAVLEKKTAKEEPTPEPKETTSEPEPKTGKEPESTQSPSSSAAEDAIKAKIAAAKKSKK